MSKQAGEYHLNIAGEFFVAAQLQRLRIPASVTYGNAKKADVVAFSEDGAKAVTIEVKSTSQPKWIIGSYIPTQGNNPWVLVYIPPDAASSPAYYIMTQNEIREIVLPVSQAYNAKYKEKHGVEYGNKPGVVSLAQKDAEAHKDAWHKIIEQLKT
jgi:hypothetical protein